MLDVRLRNVSFRYPDGFALQALDASFPASSHTAVLGVPGSGATTLLRLIAGLLRPAAGDLVLGDRRVNDLKPARRPLLHVTSDPVLPGRWSVEHALVAAVRTRSLDRVDRLHELQLAAAKWGLEALLRRKIATLSSHESVLLAVATIDLRRPAIVLADRLLERASATSRRELADAFYRTLRVHGTTVISAPASRDEIALTDRVVVLDGGTVVQSGAAREVYARPVSLAAARATGEADAIPVTVRGTEVDSAAGRWTVADPPFQGDGIAVVRPEHFTVAGRDEESDLIFGVEEAGFSEGRWIALGLLSGGSRLRIELPAEAPMHKGKLLALRYDPARFVLFPGAARPASRVPTDVVPPMRETR